ncbi:hypothetical protein F4778DRAFT_221675 [Xylariomycetidae sp. FL2044]|nr:hypothetical protein F4778DRAFT_221675 [Xylariomycetidae sp. FL2044]
MVVVLSLLFLSLAASSLPQSRYNTTPHPPWLRFSYYPYHRVPLLFSRKVLALLSFPISHLFSPTCSRSLRSIEGSLLSFVPFPESIRRSDRSSTSNRRLRFFSLSGGVRKIYGPSTNNP